MSDTFVETTEVDPVIDGQADAGEAEAGEEAPLLDIEQYRGHRVPVKVDGEELYVPFEEAVAGYSRQADYTRKTQELAAQRQDLQWAAAIRGALDNDPKGTLDLLSQHYGIGREAAKADDDPYGFAAEGDPGDARLSEFDKRIRAFEEREAESRLHGEIARLRETYGEDFDPTEVVTAALQRGSDDLEATFKSITYDRVVARQKQSAAAEAKRAQKQSAAVVSGGGSAAGGRDDVGVITSIEDAYRAAVRQLGA